MWLMGGTRAQNGEYKADYIPCRTQVDREVQRAQRLLWSLRLNSLTISAMIKSSLGNHWVKLIYHKVIVMEVCLTLGMFQWN